MSATIEDLLMAAEYILAHGNQRVMLCERGIRTFDNRYTRNSFDINAIPLLKELSHLPIIADPSHATGVRRYVEPDRHGGYRSRRRRSNRRGPSRP